ILGVIGCLLTNRCHVEKLLFYGAVGNVASIRKWPSERGLREAVNRIVPGENFWGGRAWGHQNFRGCGPGGAPCLRPRGNRHSRPSGVPTSASHPLIIGLTKQPKCPFSWQRI